MLTLHHLEYSQSFRILWLLEELGIDYELKSYSRHPETFQAPAEYKALSSLGTAPVITDGDLVLAESAAIMEYILDRTDSKQYRPAPGDSNRERYLFWFHAAQGSMMPLMLMEAVFQILKQRVPFLIRGIIRSALGQASERMIKPRMEKLLMQAEKDLANKPWFGGDQLSAADILIIYPLESARSRGYITDEYPNCLAWFDRVAQTDSFQSAQRKDGRDCIVLQV